MSNISPVTVDCIEHRSNDVPTVAQWIIDEWGNSSLDEAVQQLIDSRGCPSTLLAVVDDQPVGVVDFRRYQREEDAIPTLWVNVLYVVESFRGHGIGSVLLAEAIRDAQEFAETILVYTDLPEFYLAKGWTLVDQRDDAMPKTLTWKF